MTDLDPELNTRCDHGNSPVTCSPCLTDACREADLLAQLEESL